MKRVCLIATVLVLLVGIIPGQVFAAPAEVEAKSAVLMDAATGTVIYEQNAHEKLPPASVTKVMTMLLIMEAIDGGQLDWGDTVTASEAAAAKGGSQVYLKAGEAMTVSDMVKSIAVSSANDCACAMAEHLAGSEEAFVEKMNQRAMELGMADTHFVNCTGLDDDPNAAEHLTSAWDIAIMSQELLSNHPDIKKYTTIWMDTIRDGTFGLSNTNKLVRFYPGATGLKTGFTSAAGYCLSASAARDGMELIAVVLGGETSPKRFAACRSLLDYGFANYALVIPEYTGQEVAVELGTKDTVTAIPARQPKLLVEKGLKGSITTRMEKKEQVAAPVSQGQHLGTLTVRAGEQVLEQIPLVAAETVPKLTFFQVWQRVWKSLAMGQA